mmetsp:Transcript_12493/g.29280  ORF Transcript_12493/g.29280 Transcript_12493/m.29280 type:complete len:720 (+) Transcript_12493:224-2383(+)
MWQQGNFSTFARGVISDGDAVKKTEDDEDEDYSTMGNATYSRHTLSVEEINSHNTESIQECAKNDDNRKQSTHKVVKALLKKIIPRKIRKQSALFLTSMIPASEYQEMTESEGDSNTIISERSTRKDLGTGRSMLVKQNAQVVSRPSGARGRWEMSEASPSDAKSYIQLIRERSLILDESSVGGMSDMTEDTSFYTSSSFRRTPMYIDPIIQRIEEEEEEKSLSDSHSSGEESNERAYDFRKLSPLNDIADSPRESNFSISIYNPRETNQSSLSVEIRERRRSFSDSEIDFERRPDIGTEDSPMNDLFPLTPNSNLSNEERFQYVLDHVKLSSQTRTLSSPLQKSGSFDRGYEREIKQNHFFPGSCRPSEMNAWPFPRTRGYSGSLLDQIPSNDRLGGPGDTDLTGKTETKNFILTETGTETKTETETWSSNSQLNTRNSTSLDLQRRTALRLSQSDEQKEVPEFISRRHTITGHRQVQIPLDVKLDETGTWSSSSLLNTRRRASLDLHRRSSLPLSQSSEQNGAVNFISTKRSIRRCNQTEILWDPDETSATVPVKATDDSTECLTSAETQSQAHRPVSVDAAAALTSIPPKTVDDETLHPRPPTSSVLATSPASNNCSAGAYISKENRMPLHDCPIQDPSPRTLNAATMIAAALRPGPVQSRPTLPAQSPSVALQKDVDEYYWGSNDGEAEGGENDREAELKNLCSWTSSDSIDDVL